MTRKQMIEFFARRDEAWQRHDSIALAADHTEDGEVDSPLWGKVKGHAVLQKIYGEWFLSFPDAQYTTEHLLVNVNEAVQFVRMTGTQQGDFCGLPPGGKRFEMHCAFWFSFKGNRITHETRVYDFISTLLQLGVLKAKPAF